MIEVRDLRKTFFVHQKDPGLWGSVKSLVHRVRTPKHAVKGVTFSVPEGEILGLIGANGAGKTTLVKMLAGIIHPTDGDARVLGHQPWKRENEFRRQIALIMGQKAQLWWDLPAADCFLLLREIYGIPREQFDQALDELTEVLGVRDQLRIQVRRLSLGERMKMELIAALLHRPRVVYLDEPTIGLDLTAQRAIRDFILEYQRRFQPAMILTSHYMEDIERLCQRIMIIRQGEIVYDGSLRRVVEDYAPHKILTAHFREDIPAPPGRRDLERFGEVMDLNAETVKLHVPRTEVAAVAARLMDGFPIRDLNIEEESIGGIIENIMTARGEVPAGEPGSAAP